MPRVFLLGVHVAIALALASGGLGCAGTEALTPEQRYVQALQSKLDGDARGYHDALLALAHEAPDSRGGRRARATVNTSGWLTSLIGWGLAAGAVAWVLPAMADATTLSSSDEPGGPLRELRDAMHVFQAAHQRPCKTFAECGWQPPERATFLYALSIDEVVGGEGARDAALLRLRAEAFWSGLPPGALPPFMALAIGDADNEAQLRVVVLDVHGDVVPFEP